MYSGDFYEPLRMWSSVLQKEGWNIPKPSSEAYNVEAKPSEDNDPDADAIT